MIRHVLALFTDLDMDSPALLFGCLPVVLALIVAFSVWIWG